MKKTVLVVSDDRALLKQIDQYFGNETAYQIKFTLYSRNAFKFFVDIKPQLVVLDAAVSAGYREILGRFRQCQWEYAVLLLTDEANAVESFIDVYPIKKENLTLPLFMEQLKKADASYGQEESAFKKNELFKMLGTAYSDQVLSVLYAKSTDSLEVQLERNDLQELEAVIEIYSEIKQFQVDERDILIVINGFGLHHGESLKQLARYIFQFVSSRYAVFIVENVVYSNNEKSNLQNILAQAEFLSYFCEGEIINLNSFHQMDHEDIPYDWIDSNGAALMRGVFAKNFSAATESLHILYHFIKKGKNVFAKKYVNFLLHIIFSTLAELSRSEESVVDYSCKSCEAELEFLENEVARFCDIIHTADINITLSKSIVFMFNHLSEDISLASASEELKISKTYISKIFNVHLNTTFLDYLKKIKLEKAKFLLRESNLKIFVIAELLGYHDRHYFSRFFKKNLNLSPEEYRKKMAKGKNDASALEK